MPWNVNPSGISDKAPIHRQRNYRPQFQIPDTAKEYLVSAHLHTSQHPLTNVGIVDRNISNRELLISNLNTHLS